MRSWLGKRRDALIDAAVIYLVVQWAFPIAFGLSFTQAFLLFAGIASAFGALLFLRRQIKKSLRTGRMSSIDWTPLDLFPR